MNHTGAVAVLDALGFKGIWKWWDGPEPVVQKLLATKQTTAHFIAETLIAPGPVADQVNQERRLVFLSDTIVVASAIEPKPGTDPTDTQSRGYRYLAMLDVCRVVAALQYWFLTSAGEPPMAWRGAIAWGEFAIEDSFLVGPASDEAAEAERLAEAALVWFCPSARDQLEADTARPLGPGFNPERDLPVERSWRLALKEQRVVETAVVRPYGDTDGLLHGLERAFFERRPSQPADVVAKFSNTRDFLLRTAERQMPPQQSDPAAVS